MSIQACFLSGDVRYLAERSVPDLCIEGINMGSQVHVQVQTVLDLFQQLQTRRVLGLVEPMQDITQLRL